MYISSQFGQESVDFDSDMNTSTLFVGFQPRQQFPRRLSRILIINFTENHKCILQILFGNILRPIPNRLEESLEITSDLERSRYQFRACGGLGDQPEA